MNKKVLTTAQVRAMFKNYTMSLAVAGSVLTSASCEKGDGKKDGKSGETPSAEDAKKFVTKDDLTNATKDLAKSSSVTAVSYDDATKTLTVADRQVKIEAGSGLSVADLTKKGYKLDNDKIVETSNDKEQRTIVDILKDLMGGSTGVSLDSTEFKIDAGKLVKKDAKVDAAIKDKTVAELIVDMITAKLANTVDKTDAKIVVRGTEVGNSKKYTHEATFVPAAADAADNEHRTLELGKEIVGAKTEVEALKTALDTEKRRNDVNSLLFNLQADVIKGDDNAATVLALTKLVPNLSAYLSSNPTIDLSKVKFFTAAGDIQSAGAIVAAKAKMLEINDVAVYLDSTGHTLVAYVVGKKIDSTLAPNVLAGAFSGTIAKGVSDSTAVQLGA